MSESGVFSLVTRDVEPVGDCVDGLRVFQEEAEAGRLRAYAIVAIGSDGAVTVGSSGSACPLRMLGGLDLMKRRLLDGLG